MIVNPERDARVGDRCEVRLYVGKRMRANALGRVAEREVWTYRDGDVIDVRERCAVVHVDGEARARIVSLAAIVAVWKRPHTETVRPVRRAREVT